MELPKGQMNVVVDSSVPKTEARLYSDGQLVGRITNIECPVVSQFQKRKRGKASTLPVPKPDTSLGMVYDPRVSMDQVEKFYILSAIKTAGSIQGGAKLLGMSRETVYRKVRQYNKELK